VKATQEIKLEIQDQKFTLTREEAEELFEELRTVLGRNNNPPPYFPETLPYYHPVHPTIIPPEWKLPETWCSSHTIK